ncbi:lipoprotein insertase outer membrane protein LolB [Guyparkeria halophila]|uniref:Outer-membrane lipoprotein LolB n=1 Tax=Guyparkeria halophila TaxID=47960 RepID=A0ABZ0YTE0_9GAMM|nr:lipoprotein insertase outer membrane protein LolB [Guyparkeria halophila]WQH15419.1 lipoprotein insertase outer membrane protein LolB [Guyparkeria halophila]
MPVIAPSAALRRLAALFVVTALLSGCASLLGTQPTEPASEAQLAAWGSHASQLESMTDWSFDGRAAVRSGVTGGSVQLEWTQVGTVTSLDLSGPFDTGRLAMTGTPGHMLLTDGKGNRRVTDDPEALFEEQTGWRIPLATLPRWVRGLPSDSLDALSAGDYQLDNQGRLAAFTDEGWEVEYARYQAVGRFTLPHFVELNNDGMRIRIVVDSWDTGQSR